MKVTNFVLLRYFVNETKQLPLFKTQHRKKDLVGKGLTENYEFVHRQTTYSYIYKKTIGDYVWGVVGRKSKIKRNLSPNSGFQVQLEEDWPNCNVFINTSDQPDGQMIAFEFRSSRFINPLSAMRELADSISLKHLLGHGYLLNINTVTFLNDFWEAIDKNKGHINELTFTYESPSSTIKCTT